MKRLHCEKFVIGEKYFNIKKNLLNPNYYNAFPCLLNWYCRNYEYSFSASNSSAWRISAV